MHIEMPLAPLLPNTNLTAEVLAKVRQSPQIRGWKSQITAALLVVAFTISGILTHVYLPDEVCGGRETNSSVKCENRDAGIAQGVAGAGVSLYFGLVVFLAELLRRSCLLVEEMFHLKTRYNGEVKRVFHQVFLATWKAKQLCVAAGAVFILLLILCFVETSVWLEIRNNLDLALLIIAFYLLFVGLFKFNTTLVDVDTSLEKLPPSPAQGLACSHFYGYMKILFTKITKDKNQVEDWESRVKQYETKRGIKVVRKLFSLIPDACDFYGGLEAYGLVPLKKVSGEGCDTVNLEINRAGRPCPYGIIVCKLEATNGQGELYVMIDVPRALVTLKDMNDNGQLLYSLNNEQLASQAVDFKRTLDNLIRNDRDFENGKYADKIETLCLRDTGENSTAWKNRELAQLIRNRIK